MIEQNIFCLASYDRPNLLYLCAWYLKMLLSKVTQKGETTMSKITNEEEALKAVKLDGTALGDVPEELRMAEFCFEAVMQDGSVLYFAPENLKTAEL